MQVARELDAITPILLDDKADWEAQRTALFTIRQLIRGGAAAYPNFGPKLLVTVHRLAKLVRFSTVFVELDSPKLSVRAP